MGSSNFVRQKDYLNKFKEQKAHVYDFLKFLLTE